MRYERKLLFAGYSVDIIKDGSKAWVQLDAHAPENGNKYMQEALETDEWEVDLALVSQGLSLWHKPLTRMTTSQLQDEAQILVGNLYQAQRKFLYLENLRMGLTND